MRAIGDYCLNYVHKIAFMSNIRGFFYRKVCLSLGRNVLKFSIHLCIHMFFNVCLFVQVQFMSMQMCVGVRRRAEHLFVGGIFHRKSCLIWIREWPVAR